MRNLGRLRRLATALVCAAALLALLWAARDAILQRAGGLLVSEDPVEAVDVIVVSSPTMTDDLLEAAHLYHQSVAPEIVFPAAPEAPYEDELRRLGMHRLPPAQYATWFLEQVGVPRSAVHVLPETTDGTETSISAVGAYAREHRPQRLLFVVNRSHTRRSRWLLERQLAAGTKLVIRSPATDDFDPASWWQSRRASREVVLEYLRWINSFVLGDPWAPPAPPLEQAGDQSSRGNT